MRGRGTKKPAFTFWKYRLLEDCNWKRDPEITFLIKKG